MSTLLYALDRGPIPANEQIVRSTTEYVNDNKPAAEMPDAPSFNEVETDPDPGLGLNQRQLASHWVERDKYAPGWAGEATSITNDLASLNRRQAVQGTAASREMAGQFGHGTMAYALGIEPVLRDGAAYGTDYFAVDARGVQEDVRVYLNPAPGSDRDSVSAVGGAAKDYARDAATAGMYAQWYSKIVGAH